MTIIYFIRHTEADFTVSISRNRPLTEKGLADRRLVTEFLQDKNIDAVLSSPYKRAIDTVAPFAEKNGFEIKLVEDFREVKTSNHVEILTVTQKTLGIMRDLANIQNSNGMILIIRSQTENRSANYKNVIYLL